MPGGRFLACWQCKFRSPSSEIRMTDVISELERTSSQASVWTQAVHFDIVLLVYVIAGAQHGAVEDIAGRVLQPRREPAQLQL